MKIAHEENKFTIQNFDKWISPAMLKKGKQYYDNNAVLDIGENQGNWTAEVEGSDLYNLTMSLKNDGEISEYFCDCPYDGDICKHLVAVFFAMREEIKKQKQAPKKGSKKNQFEDLLAKINVDEYREFTRQYASKSKDFKIAFEIFFADKDDRIDIGEKYTDLIRKLVKKHSSRGYVEYRESSALAKEVSKLIETGYQLTHKKNYRDGFAIAVSVLKEMMAVVTSCDDSNGSLSGTVFYAVELIDDIAKSDDAAIDMKGHIFSFLQTELNNKLYFDYGDFGYNLFAVFEDLAIQLNRAKEFLDFIDALLLKFTGEYGDYKRKFLKTSKIDFLKAIGRTDEAEALVQQNLEIESIRQGEINKAIDKKDFARAKKLANDGIRIAEAVKHPGTVKQWEKELLRIAVLEKDIPLVRYYCKRFAFDRRGLDREYYNQLKDTYNKEEWYAILEAHINETIQRITKDRKPGWGSLNSLLLEALNAVYIEEKYWDRLLALVKTEDGLEILMRYHSYLAPHYPEEMLQLYLPALMLQGDKASDRSQYTSLVGTMKKIIKDIPQSKDSVIAIAKSLKDKYPRKPAMIDELNGILK
ncbi:MAG TPA: hypothetical protein DCO83_02870 [Mucilaginibacter sp.]|nr:hypothetical protein [Mucilaginibacter sp.]